MSVGYFQRLHAIVRLALQGFVNLSLILVLFEIVICAVPISSPTTSDLEAIPIGLRNGSVTGCQCPIGIAS
jgi:hypothetical protein